MTRILSVLSLFLVFGIAHAEIPAEVPAQSNMAGFIGFGAFFVALCVGFVWLVVWNDKKQKAKQAEEARQASGKAA
jgi:hypothetical protein